MHLMPRQVRCWLCAIPVDMRKGFDGLSGLVRSYLEQDPLTGDVFVFISRARTHMKLLFWDGDGFVLYYKRLEKGRFDFPVSAGVSRQLRREELLMLIEGVVLSQTQRKARYQLPDQLPVGPATYVDNS